MMANKNERDYSKKAAVKSLKEGFRISGDGVASRVMSNAVTSERFKKSLSSLGDINIGKSKSSESN